MAQWITRLTTDQKIAGSNPVRVSFLLVVHISSVRNPFVQAIKPVCSMSFILLLILKSPIHTTNKLSSKVGVQSDPI